MSYTGSMKEDYKSSEKTQEQMCTNIVNISNCLKYMNLDFCQILVIPDNGNYHCFQWLCM